MVIAANSTAPRLLDLPSHLLSEMLMRAGSNAFCYGATCRTLNAALHNMLSTPEGVARFIFKTYGGNALPAILCAPSLFRRLLRHVTPSDEGVAAAAVLKELAVLLGGIRSDCLPQASCVQMLAFFAAAEGHAPVIQHLASTMGRENGESGPWFDPDMHGGALLVGATVRGHTEVVSALLEAGANQRTNGYMAVSAATHLGRKLILAQLVSAPGAHVATPAAKKIEACLAAAVARGPIALTAELINCRTVLLERLRSVKQSSTGAGSGRTDGDGTAGNSTAAATGNSTAAATATAAANGPAANDPAGLDGAVSDTAAAGNGTGATSSHGANAADVPAADLCAIGKGPCAGVVLVASRHGALCQLLSLVQCAAASRDGYLNGAAAAGTAAAMHGDAHTAREIALATAAHCRLLAQSRRTNADDQRRNVPTTRWWDSIAREAHRAALRWRFELVQRAFYDMNAAATWARMLLDRNLQVRPPSGLLLRSALASIKEVLAYYAVFLCCVAWEVARRAVEWGSSVVGKASGGWQRA